MKFYFYFLLSVLLIVACKTKPPLTEPPIITPEWVFPQQPDPAKTLQTIAFGSCNKENEPQPLWEQIIAYQPDLWIWLGDNIYGDTSSANIIQSKYNLQSKVENYQGLLKNTPIVGTWDDHDYGENNGGKDFVAKDQNGDLLLDFLGVPIDAVVRKREGIYQSYTLGEEGKQVKVILLDSRYFRDEPNRKEGGGYHPNLEGTILGDTQWEWLENELQNSTAQIHLIANGIQVIPEEHRFEKWANFPNERQRLFDMIRDTKAKRVILLSGDRHIAEISKLDIGGMESPLYEFTSSGLTHSYSSFISEPNRHRISEVCSELNFGVLQITWGQQIEVQAMIRGMENQDFGTIQFDF